MGFGQINSDKVDFMFCLELLNLRKSRRNRVFSCLCVHGTSHVGKEVYVEIMIRKNPPKQTKISWGHLFFRAVFANSKCWAAYGNHIVPLCGKNIPPGWLHHENGLNLWYSGTLNEWHFVHLWSIIRRFLEIRLKERQTNRDRKHHQEVQVPCLCAWIISLFTLI